MLEVHPVHAGDKRRGNSHHRDDGQYFNDIVLLDADHAQRRIKEKLDFIGKMPVVVVKRGDVLPYRLEPRLYIFRKPLAAKTEYKGNYSGNAEQAVADLRDEIAIMADTPK